MERSAHSNIYELYSMLKTTKNGLHTVRIARSRVQYGENVLATGNRVQDNISNLPMQQKSGLIKATF
ncbi:MAG: hypothetical protein GX233_04610 [Erysipelothrix sp.]|nr:hypothetical protein [Erysipelothrix sp.]